MLAHLMAGVPAAFPAELGSYSLGKDSKKADKAKLYFACEICSRFLDPGLLSRCYLLRQEYWMEDQLFQDRLGAVHDMQICDNSSKGSLASSQV